MNSITSRIRMKLSVVCLLVAAAVVHLGHGGKENACKSHNKGYGPFGTACKIYACKVKESDKKLIVSEHNRLRSYVANGKEMGGIAGPLPKAADMLKMTWNDDLADMAQQWADRCNIAQFFIAKERYAQNIFAISSYKKSINWTEAIESWYGEVKRLDMTNTSSIGCHQVKQNAQFAWAKRHKVGCGYVSFEDQYKGNRYIHFIVCNYAPKRNDDGNWQPLYKQGEPCSACPSGKESCSDGLCFASDCFNGQSEDDRKYCEMDCEHTMCQYNGYGKNCKFVSGSKVADKDKKLIVNEHNRLRSLFANKIWKGQQVANMLKMTWDEELANIAQRWADQCPQLNHDTSRRVSRFRVGQELGRSVVVGHFKGFNWTSQIDFWSHHLESLVSANMHKIGCGYIEEKKNGGYSLTAVCNFGPAKLRLFDDPFNKEGKPCSACPDDKPSCDNGLCY